MRRLVGFGHKLQFEAQWAEERHNLYFYASDGQPPFDAGWPSMVRL
jgi:hypothetical protein